ncbi:hypothetical protein [Sandaracinus amylolyticus]|uniref:Uncharacterized protein n=1 Tax=Sandaracinus amylolyticus TaxID=927083 RepID=A0A0F6W452_9BACT|nr:hypothetical protein [Sandaracinus amylolyticus]AKF07018.1 hypothetical protein DB32_004167 [Sandaracinus amylolyticus]
MKSGPDIATLVRRLAETPEDFLAAPRIGASGVIDVAAIVGDVLWEVSGQPMDRSSLTPLDEAHASRANLLRLRAIAAWLFHEPSLRRPELAKAMLAFLLAKELEELATLVDASLFVRDPERREELARRALLALEMVPDGETEAQARDRLSSLDSVERTRVIEAARQAEARARRVRVEMARKAAEEAAAKVSRE